jgi:hypothetical protein
MSHHVCKGCMICQQLPSDLSRPCNSFWRARVCRFVPDQTGVSRALLTEACSTAEWSLLGISGLWTGTPPRQPAAIALSTLNSFLPLDVIC